MEKKSLILEMKNVDTNVFSLPHQIESFLRFNGVDNYNSNISFKIFFYIPRTRVKKEYDSEFKPIIEIISKEVEKRLVGKIFNFIGESHIILTDEYFSRLKIEIHPELITN
jgi:hypothetical protein